jgi:uncharacterized protein YlzI (FlbEa/FlbD family)
LLKIFFSLPLGKLITVMAKKKDSPETTAETTTPVIEAVPETENVVTIHVIMNGKTIVKTFTVKSEDEIEEKIKRIQRSVKFWGSILVRILVNGKANQKLIDRINKILGK